MGAEPHALVFAEILERIERAALAGKRLTLDADHARAIVGSRRVYSAMCDEKSEEMAELWGSGVQGPRRQPEDGSNSDRSGSGTGQTEMTGKSAGTMTGQDRELVERAASRRASAVVELISHRRRPRTPLPTTMPDGGSPNQKRSATPSSKTASRIG